ncbi:MAG: HAD family hydrolase, partial [Candidatus Binataceae bacterium]
RGSAFAPPDVLAPPAATLVMLRAIIFDLDGTLADTEPLHFEAFNQVLRNEGIQLEREDYFARLIGYNDRDCFTLVMAERGKAIDVAKIDDLIARKAAVYQAMIATRDVMCPGAVRFVEDCAQRFPLLIVTGTLRKEAEMILSHAGLRGHFLDIIAADDVTHGKPAADGFMLALGRLGFILRPRPSIVAAECLVIEDTAAGITAARRAGMRVLALCHTANAHELAAADLVRPSFEQTDLDDVLTRLARIT